MIEIKSDDLKKLSSAIIESARSLEKSSGFYAQREMLNYIYFRNVNRWPPVRNISIGMSKFGLGKFLRGDRDPVPLSWLARFVSYKKRKDGHFAVGFPDEDPINEYIRRAESGERISVSDKMRKYIAWKQYRGGYKRVFLKKQTKELVVPKRPILNPAKKIIEQKIPAVWEKSFANRLEAKINGLKWDKKKWRYV